MKLRTRLLLAALVATATLAGCAVVPIPAHSSHSSYYGPPPDRVVIVRPAPSYYAPPPARVYYAPDRHRHWH